MTTRPTGVPVEAYLGTVGDTRRKESETLIAMMREISGEEPYMWGPSIIGFGTQHYEYDSGREGDMPRLAFSPRKASLTVYLNEGFDSAFADDLSNLGKHKSSKVCLYINKLEDIDLTVLRRMLDKTFAELAA